MSLKRLTNELTLKQMLSAACLAGLRAAMDKKVLAAAPRTDMTGIRDSILDAELWTASAILASILPGVTQGSMVAVFKQFAEDIQEQPQHITTADIEHIVEKAFAASA